MLWTDPNLTKKGWWAVTEPVLSYTVIDVEFNPAAIGSSDIFSFSIAGVPWTPKVLTVKPGIATIVFRLSTRQPALFAAAFQTSPVQWFETSETGTNTLTPTLTPQMFVVQHMGDQVLTIQDFNS